MWGKSRAVWKDRAAADGLCPHTQPREPQELVRPLLQALFELFCGAERLLIKGRFLGGESALWMWERRVKALGSVLCRRL